MYNALQTGKQRQEGEQRRAHRFHWRAVHEDFAFEQQQLEDGNNLVPHLHDELAARQSQELLRRL